jgi:hypothetical protein
VAKKAESRLQKRISTKLKKQCGGKWYKVHGGPFQEKFKPDLDGVCEGLAFKFEVKIPLEGTPSEGQLEELERYREAGAIACIVETPDQAVTLVKAATASPSIRCKGGIEIYRWICATLRAAYGEDLGYGRGARGSRRPRRSARWAQEQSLKYLGEVLPGKDGLLLGMP